MTSAEFLSFSDQNRPMMTQSFMSEPRSLPSGTAYETLLESLRLTSPWATDPVAHKQPERAADELTAAPAAWSPAWELIDSQAAGRGGQVALAHADGTMTYAELRRCSDAGAARLRAAGVRQGDVVTTVLDRGPGFVAGALAVWKAGAAYLPLDPADPAGWRSSVVGRAGSGFVIAANPEFAEPGAAFLGIDRLLDVEGVEETGPGSEPAEASPEDLAYIICTSGSSGVPKLVQIEHRGVTALARALPKFFGDSYPDERILQFFHPSYDAALFTIFWALTRGARLEIVGPEQTRGGAQLARFLVQQRVTGAVLPAPVLRTLHPGGFPDLRTMMSAGDVCTPETARLWSADHEFINGYGPTEATVCTTMYTVRGEVGEVVPIGPPIDGWRVHLVDEYLQEVPDGEVGEIWIAGDGVGRGYLGQPELTARCFLPDPFVPAPGALVYRSGDLGRRLPGGSIEFAGRRDDQVKVRGGRVELGHLEQALAALAGVRQAAARATDGFERSLIGYVQAEPGLVLHGPLLREALASSLPGVLVPDRIEILDEWPLTPSGKVDRARLPLPHRESDAEYQPPGTPTEQSVAAIALELLGVDRIGVHDDLLAAGAHSLLAAQFAARIRAVLGIEVELGAVLRAASIAQIAEACDAVGRSVDRSAGRPADRGPQAAAAPPAASFGQERVWLMHKLNPLARAYNSQSALRFAGPFDLEALNAALTDLVARHDVLRSRFPERDGQLTCRLVAPAQVRVPVLDLSDHDPADHAAELGKAVRDSVAEPFDLERDQPLRWLLVRLAEDEHVLLHVEHHTVHDGWTFNVFVRELLGGYADYLSDGVVRRARPEVQYYDYARWQREWTDGPQADTCRAFWRDFLAGAPTVLPLPRLDAAGPRSFRGATPRMEIPGPLARRLERLADRHQASLFNVMLAGFFVLLSRFSGSQDVLVASAFANRRWRATEDLLGMFVNTVVLRGQMQDEPAFDTFLRWVRQSTHQVLEHQDLPFEMILAQSPAHERTTGTNPLVQASFNFHDSALGPLAGVPFDVTLIEGLSNGSAKFDVSIIAVPRRGGPGKISRLPGGAVHIPGSDRRAPENGPSPLDGITLAWEFDQDALDPLLIESMMAGYLELLEAAAQHPETRVTDLPLLDAGRRESLLETGRGPALEPGETWLPRIVADWAGRTPDAPAVGWGREVTSYRRLRQLGDATADCLRGLGIGGQDVVAVLAPHTAALVVGQLGALTARAAVLPLDPRSPAARLADLVSRSGARALITTAELASLLPEADGIPLVVLDDDGTLAAGAAQHSAGDGTAPAAGANRAAPGAETDADGTELAFVIFTSGSTGAPKGVLLEHGSVARRLRDPEATGLYPGARMSGIHSAAFDACVYEVWGSLINGATVHLLERDWGVRELAEHITEHNLTHLVVPTALFPELLRHAPEALARLERIGVAGDVLSAPACREALRLGLGNVINLYGPTEITIVATAQRIRDWPTPSAPQVPIGSPLAETRIVILDDALRLLPPGVIGEICVGGPGVARGYLGAPQDTAERFVPDPYGSHAQERLYRTGDYGRWLTGGILEFTGRRDEQVKIRGFRVEPGEVRACLRALSGVADAYVVADGPVGERRLVGYVRPTPGTALDGDGLRAALAAAVPGHLVPSAIVTIDSWPLTHSGKIDSARLPAPRPSRPARATAPRTEAERILLAELVGALRETGADGPIGVDDDFFELGLNSLQFIRIAARVGRSLGKDIGLTDAYDHPTVARLAFALPTLPDAAELPVIPRRRPLPA
jgi:amino acid adenylation domain-containing protein